jgi:hypothetical protein
MFRKPTRFFSKNGLHIVFNFCFACLSVVDSIFLLFFSPISFFATDKDVANMLCFQKFSIATATIAPLLSSELISKVSARTKNIKFERNYLDVGSEL